MYISVSLCLFLTILRIPFTFLSRYFFDQVQKVWPVAEGVGMLDKRVLDSGDAIEHEQIVLSEAEAEHVAVTPRPRRQTYVNPRLAHQSTQRVQNKAIQNLLELKE